MNRNDVFPSKYLKAGDLSEDGSGETFTIEKVEIEEIGMNKDKKPVIHFEESDKAMVCNKTNWNTISKVLGSQDSDDWIGKEVQLYRAEVEFQGEMVEAIRVKINVPKPRKSVPINQPSSQDDDIPFW